jgi:hypothetical protein
MLARLAGIVHLLSGANLQVGSIIAGDQRSCIWAQVPWLPDARTACHSMSRSVSKVGNGGHGHEKASQTPTAVQAMRPAPERQSTALLPEVMRWDTNVCILTKQCVRVPLLARFSQPTRCNTRVAIALPPTLLWRCIARASAGCSEVTTSCTMRASDRRSVAGWVHGLQPGGDVTAETARPDRDRAAGGLLV